MPFVSAEMIDVGDRIRKDYGKDWESFKESFPKNGQLQPIRVMQKEDGRFELISGWRRLTAITLYHKELITLPRVPHGMIEVTITDTLPLHTRLLQEFAENNDRADFNFMEKAKFIRNMHERMIQQMGDAWTQELTAHLLNLSPASISHYLRVEEAAAADSSIAKAATLDAAVKRMKVNARVSQRIVDAKAEDNTSVVRAASILALGDARQWITTLEDASADLVNFDPPWGDNASHKSAENHESFDDDTESAEDLMATLFPHIFRILKNDRFCVFWHRLWATERMAQLAESNGFNLQFVRTPCIWYKPDKVADQNRFPEKQLIDAYEPFFLLRKGDPIFHEKYTHNVFAFNRVPLESVVHPTEKPLDLCNAILRLTTVPGETIVDPTAGSSAFVESAIRGSRKAKACELSPKYHERGIARLADYLKTFSDK